jgi:type IV secretion system protein VirB6
MFALLGSWLTSFLDGYVLNIVSTLASELRPIALIWLTVFIATYGLAVMRGEASESLAVFGWKMVKISFILAFSLGSAAYMDVVAGTANGLQDSMATVFIRGGYGDSAPTTVFGALDTANDAANALLKTLWGDAGITRLDLVLASLLFSLGTVIFMAFGLIVTLMAKMIMTFGLAIGPIAILTLLFKPTAKFFDAWLSFMLSAIVLSWFVFFALGLSFFVEQHLILALKLSGAFDTTGAVNALEGACTYLTFMVALAVVLWQAPHYASALTGGATMGTGAEMLAGFAGARMGSSGGGGAAGASASTAGAGGGSIARGGGMAYNAGRLAGAGGQAAADLGKAGVSGARAAYQRVARLANRK